MFDGINLQSFFFYFILFSFLIKKYFYFNNNPFIDIFGLANYNGKVFIGDSGVYLISFTGTLYIKYNP